MYGQSQCCEVNYARLVLLRTTVTSQGCVLPPNRDCLLQHTRRANYQSGIHQCAFDAKIKPLGPVKHSWFLEASSVSFQKVVCTDFCDCVNCSNTLDSQSESETDTSDDEI